MGIPKYAEWIHAAHPEGFCDGSEQEALARATHVYVDFNHFLHVASNRAKAQAKWKGAAKGGGGAADTTRLTPGCAATEAQVAAAKTAQLGGEVYNAVWRNLRQEVERIVRAFEGSGGMASLYIGIDGAASRPKVLLSRGRRRAEAKRGSLLKMGLTPGTELIRRVERDLADLCAGISRAHGIRVTLDPTDVPGEAEHKLLRAMRRHHASAALTGATTTHVLVGSDADLYPITLAAYGMLGTPATAAAAAHDVLFWHTEAGKAPPGGKGDKGAQSAFKGRVFSAGKLVRDLGARVAGPKHDAALLEQLRRDFVLLSLVGGNDYLPSAGAGGVGKAVNRYLAIATAASQAAHASWGILRATSVEDGVVRHSYHANTTLRDALQLRENPPPPPSAAVGVADVDADAGVLDDDGEGDGAAYFSSLLWVMDMYANGYPLDCHFRAASAGDARQAGVLLARADAADVLQALEGPASASGGSRSSALGDPISSITQSVASIPVTCLRYLICPSSYAVVRGLLRESDPLLGWVVRRETDEVLDNLQRDNAEQARTHAQKLAEYNAAKNETPQDPGKVEALLAERETLEEGLRAAAKAMSAHLTRYRGRDIDAVDLRELEARIAPSAPPVQSDAPLCFQPTWRRDEQAEADAVAMRGQHAGKGRGRGRSTTAAASQRYTPVGAPPPGQGWRSTETHHHTNYGYAQGHAHAHRTWHAAHTPAPPVHTYSAHHHGSGRGVPAAGAKGGAKGKGWGYDHSSAYNPYGWGGW